MLMPTLLGLIALPLDNIGKIAVFLVALSVLIVLHEAGHFLVARRNGVRVNDFAIGFGPTLLKWTSPRSGTNYRVNLLPLGGYCAMQGEDGKTSEAEQQRQFRTGERPDSDNFQAKTPWQRLAIVVAGPLANFILAFAILFVGAVAFGVASPDSWSTKIGPVNPNTPASRAGLKFGDEIVAIDGVAYDDGAAVVKKIRTSPGVPLELTYARHGTRHTVRVVPSSAKDGATTIGRIGFVRVPNYVRVGPLDAIKLAGLGVWTGIGDNFSGIAALIKNPIERSQGLSGVIGMGPIPAVSRHDLDRARRFQLAADPRARRRARHLHHRRDVARPPGRRRKGSARALHGLRGVDGPDGLRGLSRHREHRRRQGSILA
jgi:regulator of sigma E protease